MDKVLPYIKARLGEASTWRGVAVLLALVGIQIDAGALTQVGEGVIALMAIFAVFSADKKA